MIIDKIHEGSFYRAKWLEIERAPDYQYERISIIHQNVVHQNHRYHHSLGGIDVRHGQLHHQD